METRSFRTNAAANDFSNSIPIGFEATVWINDDIHKCTSDQNNVDYSTAKMGYGMFGSGVGCILLVCVCMCICGGHKGSHVVRPQTGPQTGPQTTDPQTGPQTGPQTTGPQIIVHNVVHQEERKQERNQERNQEIVDIKDCDDPVSVD